MAGESSVVEGMTLHIDWALSQGGSNPLAGGSPGVERNQKVLPQFPLSTRRVLMVWDGPLTQRGSNPLAGGSSGVEGQSTTDFVGILQLLLWQSTTSASCCSQEWLHPIFKTTSASCCSQECSVCGQIKSASASCCSTQERVEACDAKRCTHSLSPLSRFPTFFVG